MADGTEGGERMKGWGWVWGGGAGGDLNLKGALPQWESLLMNNHTDEPQSEGGTGDREKTRRETSGGEKQTRYLKKTEGSA